MRSIARRLSSLELSASDSCRLRNWSTFSIQSAQLSKRRERLLVWVCVNVISYLSHDRGLPRSYDYLVITSEKTPIVCMEITKAEHRFPTFLSASSERRALDAGLADIGQQGAPGQVRTQAEHGRPAGGKSELQFEKENESHSQYVLDYTIGEAEFLTHYLKKPLLHL